MTAFPLSLKLFSSLNRAPGAVWTEATKRKAPHKPLLLLAVLDLVHRGVITSPFIAVSGDLVELNELFNLYWRRIVPQGQTSSYCFGSSRSSIGRHSITAWNWSTRPICRWLRKLWQRTHTSAMPAIRVSVGSL